MTLDLAAIAEELGEMVKQIDPAFESQRFTALRGAWDDLDSQDVNRRFQDAQTTFLIPGPSEDFRRSADLPPPLDNVTVCAADGSFVLPSRHSPARYYLINTGTVRLQYGDNPRAEIASQPKLFYRDEDLHVPDVVSRIPVNGTNIGPRRAAEELMAATSIVDQSDANAVVLQDGTLILWALETLPDAVRDWTLPTFLQAMDELKDANVPLASYVSAPGSREILNMLRIAVCDYPPSGRPVNCDHCRRTCFENGTKPACDILPPVTDRYLFAEVADLQPGQRTTIYQSQSKILQQYGPEHWIHFFYVHTGIEIGRVEIPTWVANDPELVQRVHRVIYDQCQLGLGYPVALQESHEAAVLSVTDRRIIEDVIERELASHGVVLTHTGKDLSKRVRAV